MSILAEIRERRLLPWLGAYAAAGFLALEGVDQAVGNALLPAVAYRITLILYLFGVPFAGILAWFHGKKGTQRPPPLELWLLSGVTLTALAVSAMVFRDYQSAARASALAAASTLDARKIAVLYFRDLSPGGELTYLADGLTESLIDNLSLVGGLDVISRNGVTPYRDSGLPRDSIARALGAGSLVDGSIEDLGGRLRVTVRLVEGTSGVDFQRQSFELPAGEFLAVRDSLAQSASALLRERLGEEVRTRERRAGTSSVEAWALLQRGERTRKEAEDLAHHDTGDGLAAYERADSLFALAQIADPQWVEPIVLRARTAYERARLYDTDPHSAAEWIQLGLGRADTAVTMGPNLPDALEIRGTLRYLGWLQDLTADPDEADALFAGGREDLERAVQIDDTRAGAYSVLSHLYSQTGDLMSVAITAQRAYQEDAYLTNADVIIYRLFTASYDLEQQSQSKRWCAEGRRRYPHDARFAECQLRLLTMAPTPPDIDRAWQIAEEWAELIPEHDREYIQHLARLYVGGTIARAGLTDSADAVLVRARADRDLDPRRDLAWTEAYMRVLLGDHDEAIDLLAQWVAANPDQIHGHESEGDIFWWWRDLQNDPRFRRVMLGG